MPLLNSRLYVTAFTAFFICSLSSIANAVELEEVQAALSARVSFTDLQGTALEVLPRGKPFNITVSIDNVIGNEPPAGLYLNGWLRQQSIRNLNCQAAARAYLATGRTPIGSVDLNGSVIGVLTEEGHLTIADPEIDLATANLIGATSFDEVPTAFVSDPETNRFFVSLGQAGDVEAVHTFGALRVTMAEDLDNPGTLIPAGQGAVWVHERGSGDLIRLGLDGSRERKPIGAVEISSGVVGHSLLVRADNKVHLLDRKSSEPLASLPMQTISRDSSLPSITDAVVIEDSRSAFATAILAGSSVAIHYQDEPERAINIAVGSQVKKISIDPSGQFLFAYSPEGGDTYIIDIARSRLAQVVGAGEPVVDIAFTDNAAFLMLADQSMVGVIELKSIKAGQHAKVREVALGQPGAPALPNSDLLTSLTPRNEMLAIHAKSYTGFVIHESSAMGDAPPMSAIKLRGGVPHRVAALDRSFKEVTTGTFRTTAMLPPDGQFELVVTTGIGSMSACIPLVTENTGAVDSLEPGSISILETSDGSSWANGSRMKLYKANGHPAQGVRAEVTFAALEANWLLRAFLETDEQGVSRDSYKLPPLGEYVVTVTTNTSQEFQPLVLQVEQ